MDFIQLKNCHLFPIFLNIKSTFEDQNDIILNDLYTVHFQLADPTNPCWCHSLITPFKNIDRKLYEIV